MNTKVFILLAFLALILAEIACKKKDSGGGTDTGAWNLTVKEPAGDTIVLAKGTFIFNPTTFSVHIVTSRIGGGAIVKAFDMSGQMVGDSMIVNNFVLNLTDPVEVVTVSGRVGVGATTMNGFGNYSGYQPPDTITFSGNFVVVGRRE